MSLRSNVKGMSAAVRAALVVMASPFGVSGSLLLAQADAGPAAAPPPPSHAEMDKVVHGMWPKVEPGWESRLVQDQTQAVCSRYRNNPPADEANAISEREAATVQRPTDGNVLGNWKEGEKIASNGRGGQFSDPPDTANGGNCYACHQLAKSELAYGTLGPSLANYGKDRDYSPDLAKAAFAKIYNPHAAVACSNMPRFGSQEFLTEQQIKDVVAFLFDRESPVNK